MIISKKRINEQSLPQALQLLGSYLAKTGQIPVSLIVCGGSALIATGLVLRTTQDVDVVAMLDENGQLLEAEPLPQSVLEGARLVAAELGLPANWLNNGPRSIVNLSLPNHGLPEGFLGRLQQVDYGLVLRVYYLDRYDQIHFKFFAAADKGGPSYHLDDLNTLQPTEAELLAAARWTMEQQDPSPAFAETVKAMLRHTGYENLAAQL